MRTAVTLDDDVIAALRTVMRGVGVGKINRLLSAWDDDDILRKLELGK
jgi:hypothetical protein